MSDYQICRWIELGPPERDGLIADLDQIFFSSSARQSFESEQDKAQFRERWLGRYLKYFPDCTIVALDEARRAIGYVTGSLDDPAQDPLFADLAFFADFAALTARYPAQLHINIDANWRGRGIGAGLVGAFLELAGESGAPGVHAITTRGMRNIGFYLANGFQERGAATINDRELVFLGRDA
jgi:GNAT superfamily N-acetyltransferase